MNNLSGIRLPDIRRAVGEVIEEARAAAWAAMSSEHGERATISVEWLVRHVERLSDLDRAIAHLGPPGREWCESRGVVPPGNRPNRPSPSQHGARGSQASSSIQW